MGVARRHADSSELEIGTSDGKHTEVMRDDLQAGQAVIVDQTASKR